MGTWKPPSGPGAGADLYLGGPEDDYFIDGFGGADVLHGGGGNDFLVGGDDGATDILRGEAGDDQLQGSMGDQFFGGPGFDSAGLVASVSGALIDLRVLDVNRNGVLADGTKFSGVEDLFVSVLTSDSAVRLNVQGYEGVDRMFGGIGADILRGNGGDDDLMQGNLGGDRILGGNGDDNLYGALQGTVDASADLLLGGAGDNSLDGGRGDTFDGGVGVDFASYRLSAGETIIDFRPVDALGHGSLANGTTFNGVEAIGLVAQPGAPSLVVQGYVGTDAVSGGGGADRLYGNAGDDFLNGYWGNDVLNGGEGEDQLFGGVGSDTAAYVGAAAGVTVTLATTLQQDTIGAGRDTLEKIENLIGSNFNDNLTGNSGANILEGASGADALFGGAGDDTVSGQAGHDALTGGPGRDVFLFNTRPVAGNSDAISDFSAADDVIQLENGIFKTVGAPGVLAPGAFFTGASAHDASDRIIYNADAGALFYDADGDGVGAGILIATLSAHLILTNADFEVI